jgi:hypothetical protein
MPRFCMGYPRYYSADSVQKKRRPTGRLLSPKRFHSSDAAIDSLTATIVTAIHLCATTIEAPVYPVALAIEAIRQMVASGGIRTSRLPVEPTINAVTLRVQAMFDAVAPIIESVLDAVTGIRKRGATNDQQSDSYCNCLPGIHIKSPLYPYKVMLSVGTTKPTDFG